MPTPRKNAPLDFTTLRRAARYHWREIEREDDEPLRVKVLDLSMAETDAIPLTMKTPLREALEVVAPYVVEWNFRAVNTVNGETIDVPPPAEAGAEVFDLLTIEESGAILSWLKYPQQMRGAEAKKALPPSKNTPG